MPGEPEQMRCKKCGYDLRELAGHRCPECGLAFDPLVVGSYLSKPVSGTRFIKLALLAAAFYAVPLIGTMFLPAPVNIFIVIPLAVVMLVSGFFISWYVVEQGYKAIWGKLPWIENRRGFFLALIICGLIYFGPMAYGAYRWLSRW